MTPGATSLLACRYEALKSQGENFRTIDIILPRIVNVDPSEPRISELPLEIRSGTFNDALAYIHDLGTHGVPVYRSKLMLVGHQAVGKTSMLNTILPLRSMFTRSVKKIFGSYISLSGCGLFGPHLMIMGDSDETSLHVFLDGRSKMETTVADSVYTIKIVIPQHADFKGKKMPSPITLRQIDVGLSVSRASDVPECKFNAMISPSYGTIIFEFIDRSEYDAWVASVSHWTNNSATHGIDTVTQIVPGEGDKPPIQIRFMDFAGQEE